MGDEHRDSGERVERTGADTGEPTDTDQAAPDAAGPAAEDEQGVPSPASQEMGSTADVARSVHESASERRESRAAPGVDDRTATGFTDDTGERPTDPDQPLSDAESAVDVAGVPESVGATHEAEGLTTLEEMVEAPSGESDRFSELMAKRKRIGLTDREAEELGRLVAEREGQSHWSAQSSREQQSPESEA
jgi:hypothetical protein